MRPGRREEKPGPSTQRQQQEEEKQKATQTESIPSRVNRNNASIVVPVAGSTGYHQSVSGVPLSGPSPPLWGVAEPWLGLDVGTRRIGVALSNALGIAQPLLTIERTQPRRDQRSILRLARRHHCVGIVLGNPLHLSGDPSRQTERVHQFVDELKSLIAESPDHAAIPVHLWDER